MYSKEQIESYFEVFLTFQFSHFPLVWMGHSRALNNKIKTIHERALILVYEDRLSTFEELLNKDKSFTIQHRNLQVLGSELY